MTMSGRDEVLAWAADSRRRRAEIVAGVAEGTMSLAEVLEARFDPLTGPIKVVVVVQAIPAVGKVVARRVLNARGLEGARLADLDDEASAALLEAVLVRSTPSAPSAPAAPDEHDRPRPAHDRDTGPDGDQRP
jgi:hypothetical protein